MIRKTPQIINHEIQTKKNLKGNSRAKPHRQSQTTEKQSKKSRRKDKIHLKVESNELDKKDNQQNKKLVLLVLFFQFFWFLFIFFFRHSLVIQQSRPALNSPHSPSWFPTLNPPVSSLPVLGLQVYTTRPTSITSLLKIN